ncbi:hypothetical protein ACFX19_044513 [Malus domestica]
MADIVKQILVKPIQLADQVTKAANEASSSKLKCLELKSKTEKLVGLFRQAARASPDLYELPTRRIIDETEQVLDKALSLVLKCRANGIMKQVFTIILVAQFLKMSSQLENSIGDLSWLCGIFTRFASTIASATIIRAFYLTLSRDRNILKPESSKFQLPPHFVDSQNRNTQFRDVSSASSLQRIRLWHESGKLRPDIKHRVRALSNDAQFSLFSEENEVQVSSFTEFITSEQVKVVTMLALALALCNANRVVMSVAIVPFSNG